MPPLVTISVTCSCTVPVDNEVFPLCLGICIVGTVISVLEVLIVCDLKTGRKNTFADGLANRTSLSVIGESVECSWSAFLH